MTQTTAADELTAAADVLESLARAAEHDLDTSDYWSGYDKATAWRDGFVNGMGGVCSELAAIFTPALALVFADWLDEVASANARHGTALPPLARAVARALTNNPEENP